MTSPAPTPAAAAPAAAPGIDVASVLQQLVGTLQQLVAVLQAQLGAGLTQPGAPVTAGGPTAATGVAQSPVQQAPITQGAVPAQQPNAAGTDSFTVASFNTLGASHTAGGAQHPTWKSGAARTPGMISYLTSHHVDVAGLQEFQGSQQKAFASAKTGYAMAGKDDNAIIWNTQKFDLVQKSSVTIPYFDGKAKAMPIVQLRDKATGKLAWFVNVHNPADTADHHNQGGYRAKALQAEQAVVEKLRATGAPVIMVGDLNDRTSTPRTALAGAGLQASRPTSQKSEIDWIFGSNGVQFSNSAADHAPEKAQVSDHPIVTATATI